MATRFEIVLPGTDAVGLRAAAEEALEEICGLEERLSFYRHTSEIHRLNTHAGDRAVRVSTEVFRLIEHALLLGSLSDGAFDITVAPLIECWGFTRGSGSLPTVESLSVARRKVGSRWVELNAKDQTVRFLRPGMKIDLGAIGKGHAIERAAAVLRDLGITDALLHGGTSTTYALGRQADGSPWKVALEPPGGDPGRPGDAPPVVVVLQDEALSVSAVSGKSFRSGDRLLGHVLDPRSGEPVQGAVLTAVVMRSATESDALSTALLVLGTPGWQGLTTHRPGMRGWIVEPSMSGELSLIALPTNERYSPPNP